MAEKKVVSKLVEQEIKGAQVVASATAHYGGAEPLWAQLIGVKGAAALATLLQELGPRVIAAGEALETREQKLNEERQDDEPVRDARDAASAALNSAIVSVKGLVIGVFGEAALVTYGLSGDTPSTPDGRRTYARNAANLLRSDLREGADPLGRKTSTADIAFLLEQSAAPLDAARSAEAREALELTDALTARDAASAQLGLLTSFSKTLLDASLRLAGQPATADRLSARLRARAANTPDEPLPIIEPIAEG